MQKSPPEIHVIGGGLAGAEATWQAARMGAQVVVHEMRPHKSSPAHVTQQLAELVCSNSFRSDDHQHNAVGLLHEEMRRSGSLIMLAADAHALPAGGALAVDRNAFSDYVANALETLPNVTIEREEITGLPPTEWQNVIVATGPLTSDPLAKAIQRITGEDALAFFDAIAPIIHAESIDRNIVWAQSRYDKPGPSGTGADYLNCPMNEEEYNRFIDALLTAEQHQFHEWENVPYFDGCLPIEEMAARGRDTPRFGPMKPVGLTNPKDPETPPYAVVQLRQDNAMGSLWNIVGFQTKMKYGRQAEILRLIPGLQNAQFARLGGLHHNTFLNSPKVLTGDLRLKAEPRLRFAGQITGVEGYVESAAIGLMAGRLAAAEVLGREKHLPSSVTAHGGLLRHITEGHVSDESTKLRSFQPMNVNFGLFPAIEIQKPEGVKSWRKAERALYKKKCISARALEAIAEWNAAYSLDDAVNEASINEIEAGSSSDSSNTEALDTISR